MKGCQFEAGRAEFYSCGPWRRGETGPDGAAPNCQWRGVLGCLGFLEFRKTQREAAARFSVMFEGYLNF